MRPNTTNIHRAPGLRFTPPENSLITRGTLLGLALSAAVSVQVTMLGAAHAQGTRAGLRSKGAHSVRAADRASNDLPSGTRLDAWTVSLPLGGYRSVRIRRIEEPLYSEPSTQSAKRGAAAMGALLPVFGVRRGPGCGRRWFHVGPHAFVCEEGAELSMEAPVALDEVPAPTADGLPFRYYFVGRDGSFGYRNFQEADLGVPDAQFQPGFGIAVERTAQGVNSDPFGLTTRGFWVPMRDLVSSAPVQFEGAAFSTDLAWVVAEAAPVLDARGRPVRGMTLPRLTAVRILEERRRDNGAQYRVADEAWVRARDVVRPNETAPPPELLPGERWLDIDLSRQMVIAYVGTKAWFATLASTGRGLVGSDSATPPGTFRIWVKLRTSDMDDLERVDVQENYAIEAVPWVMFFHRGYGLHGTFWHRRFGQVRSHGCVNLAPRDAERLFYWTSPRLLPGWTAVFPNPHEPGTLVRVRR